MNLEDERALAKHELDDALQALAARDAEIAALRGERDEARTKRDEWQRELAAERRLRTTHAANAENGRVQIAALKEERDQFAEQAASRDHRDADMQVIMGINNDMLAQIAALREALREARDGMRRLPLDRDELGRQVRRAWVHWALMQPHPKPSWLVQYDELSEQDKEADRQIGETVARLTLYEDAKFIRACSALEMSGGVK